jgi:uncharacterized RmlC-like cupin family protein
MAKNIRVIHKHEQEVEIASGAMTRLAGVSENLVGAEGIHLAIATILPGQRSAAHIHTNCESALYILKGNGYFLVGNKLDEILPFAPGDFLFVPPDAPHQPVNDSTTEPVEMIVARNAPVEIVEDFPAPEKA